MSFLSSWAATTRNLYGSGKNRGQNNGKGQYPRWTPGDINSSTGTTTFNRPADQPENPGTVTSTLSQPFQNLQSGFNNLAGSAFGQLNALNSQPPAVPGYAGISPELYNEFGQSNQYAQNPYGSVGNIYQPNTSNMGSVRGASYDGSGMPQVSGINPQGIPQVSGGGNVSGGVDWSGKASGLDQAYLNKSRDFLGASAPVTGFDGLANDWYSGLRQLSQDDQNNMLAGAGDKQFLRGMLGSETGNGYNPAMKAAFSAYNDQDLKDKMAGYNVAADASQRNLQSGLAAGGFVQQNDQTRLQQAIASGQLGLQGQMANQNANLQASSANADNWLSGQGLNMQAQGMNASNWLSGQGMNLQAQGMNQNADMANIANYLQAQGMLTDASGLQANRDVAANAQTLSQNAFNFDRSNARFQNAQSMFNTGQNTINSNQANIMAQLQAAYGGQTGVAATEQGMLALQGQLAAARANAMRKNGKGDGTDWGGLVGSLANAAATAYAKSDRRLKTNIERIGTTPAGYPWYKFDYVWGEKSEGVMADEVPSWWVAYDNDGYALVDYAKVK